MAHIMTTKELSRYLQLNEITVRKYADSGEMLGIRIGRMWRFNKDVIDEWIRTRQNEVKRQGRSKGKNRGNGSGKRKAGGMRNGKG